MAEPLSQAAAPRTKISLTSNRSKPPPPKPAPANGVKRHHALLAQDEAEDDITSRPQNQTITSFGAGTSDQDTSDKCAPRIIAPLANKDWRVEGRKRQKSAFPGKDAHDDPTTERDDKIESGQVKAGLHVKVRPTPASPSPPQSPAPMNVAPPSATNEPVTEEQKALKELTGETTNGGTISPVVTEDDAFRRDYTDAPPSPTLAQYDSTPVDGFGAALLRGYLKPGQSLESWKSAQESAMLRSKRGKGHGVEAKREGKRSDLLGIGAKEVDLGGDAKSKSDFRRQKREQEAYLPLMRKNRATGEMLSETELQERLKKQEEAGNLMFEDEQRWEQKRLENGESRDDGDTARRKDRRREDGDDNEYDRRKRDRRREREREHDDDRDRRQGRRNSRDRYERRHRERSRDSHRHRR